MFISNKGPTLEMLDFAFHIGQDTDFLYFRFVSQHCLRSTLHLFPTMQIACENIKHYIYQDKNIKVLI